MSILLQGQSQPYNSCAMRLTATQHDSHQSQPQPALAASNPYDSPMTAPTATSHCESFVSRSVQSAALPKVQLCDVFLLLKAVSAIVGLDKPFCNASDWHKTGMCMPCLPGETVGECMIGCFERSNRAWHELMPCFVLVATVQ